ncbi:MAG: aminodeoxychorismate synthase component I [Chloroflexi bacterium]|nr:aminodeoxychorismate synthase component I [Chloroflexota bacterium]MDA1239674.1 aminodeoxychorismate synthase component I [Chloroflexota bacterium]MQC25535.1 aminodeoxychorismate synthase component I [Chloroflexota bacterium]MQC47754.1 aminodeoxychorismate synthase component I [Chloroflexota bacterium]
MPVSALAPHVRRTPPLVEPWTACGPAEAARRLHGRPGLAWLDSALDDPDTGRWSIVASDPRWTLTAYAGEVLLDGACGPRRLPGGAIEAFARLVEAESAPCDVPSLPFTGGAIGYLGFELGREVERLPATTMDDAGTPQLAFGWYDAALVWDGLEGHGWLVGRADAVTALRQRLEAAPAPQEPRAHLPGVLTSNMTYTQYEAAVERARDYIAAGDIYQVNLAQRFTLPLAADGLEVYGRLRAASPAPFAAYLDLRGPFGGVEVLSSSPERFLLADGERLETRPIKGTRPRGRDAERDAALADELRASRKDLAEHVMIVDLERNDLGRVAVPGSVRVPQFAALESYRHVHHLVSVVEAARRPGVGLEALLRATFPGGSISGAPKVRALEIIDELEPHVRGVYCGAIGYVSGARVDLNIAIRTITLADGVARFHVGGAIVHDSRPDSEYAETLHKARGMARALGVALPDEVPGALAEVAS